MKFVINKDILVEKLQEIVGPTTTKQNFPILTSILITALSSGEIKLIATDLDTTIITIQKANISEEGSTAVPMKRFLSIVRELPSCDITVEKMKNNLLIKCEKIEFKISTLDAEEFPRIEEEEKLSLIRINPQDLNLMIRLTSFCVGYEDANYVLNGILFEIYENEITLVSTDGKKLAVIKRNLPAQQPGVKTKLSFILPIKAINELQKLIKETEDELFLFVKENKIGFDFKKTQFIARPIEGEFPDHSQYVPKDSKDKLYIDRKNFLLGLRRADLLSTPDHRGVKLDLKKDSMVISKVTPQLGEVKEQIPVKYNGPSLQIGFNPNYLIDVLKNLEDEEVCFEFFGPDKPVILRKEGYIYLALPMKI